MTGVDVNTKAESSRGEEGMYESECRESSFLQAEASCSALPSWLYSGLVTVISLRN